MPADDGSARRPAQRRVLVLISDAITVDWLQFLRPEMKFDGVEQLRAQIGRDRENANAYFAKG